MWKEFIDKHNLDSSILSVVNNVLKFEKPTKVQNEVIPKFTKNKDVIVKACTGSGKTAAYLIPIVEMLLKYLKDKEKEHKEDSTTYFTKENEDKNDISNDTPKLLHNKNSYGILSVILIPTRELGTQVYSQLLKFKSILKGLETALVIGGKKLEYDVNKFNPTKPNIIVATPSRLCDIDKEINLSFNNVQVLVFDEADKMLELGLKPELSYLIGKFNKQRRTGLFSATMNSQMENIILTGMRNPVYIDVQINSDKLSDNFISNLNDNEDNDDCNGKGEKLITVIDDYFNRLSEIKSISQEIPKQLDNYYISIGSFNEKIPILVSIIIDKIKEGKKVMVFMATCNSVDYFNIIITKILENYFGLNLKENLDELDNDHDNEEVDDIENKVSFLINDDDASDNEDLELKEEVNNEIENSNSNNKIVGLVNTATNNNITKKLVNNKFKDSLIYKLHSKISNKKRKKEYNGFVRAKKGVMLTTDLSSRGIDIPDLDVIIQYDPPKNEEAFVHRVGRTARVGKKGESYLFLLDNQEKQFLTYLHAKNIRIKEKTIDTVFFDTTLFGEDIKEINTKIACQEIKDKNKINTNAHNNTNTNSNNNNNAAISKILPYFNNFMFIQNTSDKWIYDKAVKVFVSFIKFYSEHDLKFIFDINLLNIGELASSLQLLRLPRVKEILGKKISCFESNKEVNPNDLPYLNSNIKYQMELKQIKIEERKEEKVIQKQIAQLQKEAKNTRTKQDKKKAQKRSNVKEWDDFANEERLFKKLKQGKITKEEYDNIFMKNLK